MITAKLDVLKIDKSALFKGEKGTYLDITLIENRDGVSQYGDHGMIVQDIGKDRRLAGEKGPILGNYRIIETQPATQSRQAPASSQPSGEEEQDIPF